MLEPRVTISAVVGDSTGPESKGKQPIDYIGKKKKGPEGIFNSYYHTKQQLDFCS